MRNFFLRIMPVIFVLLITNFSVLAQEGETAVVQAVLFYSPTCPHCHEVIENVLPPLKEQYGGQLQLIGIDTSKQTGSQLYEATIEAFAIPEDRLGVPALVVGDTFLVGSLEIPEQFPGIIAQGLADGGISWPAIPGLAEAVPDLPPPAHELAQDKNPGQSAAEATAVIPDALSGESVPAAAGSSGFTLAWIILLGMVLALAYVMARLFSRKFKLALPAETAKALSGWGILMLTLAGLVIAVYLSFVEITRIEAVCGPVGECNVVQSSSYAQIMGVPVAVLGALFYLVVGLVWLVFRLTADRYQELLAKFLIVITILGTLFSIYLTAVELFAIHAVCAWCLSSAIITTAIMVIVVTAVTQTAPKSRQRHSTASV